MYVILSLSLAPTRRGHAYRRISPRSSDPNHIYITISKPHTRLPNPHHLYPVSDSIIPLYLTFTFTCSNPSSSSSSSSKSIPKICTRAPSHTLTRRP
ncbi:hypothetical protein EX30DRAFT_250594 [Ascodesmis nigricans]|uniref:Uncharacterized protein n=1 Tax=Ascodesmis nigricans TaxID=341454 RepID=A0A4V3SIW4_9PEZI|nr:hypothetical protein EX30DRAFT_250594 [Ascodesmis nigricans]